jgi:hypothetical protein
VSLEEIHHVHLKLIVSLGLSFQSPAEESEHFLGGRLEQRPTVRDVFGSHGLDDLLGARQRGCMVIRTFASHRWCCDGHGGGDRKGY